MFKERGFVVYAKTKYKDEMKEFVENFEFTTKNVLFITVNQGKYDLFKFKKNFIKFKDFMTKESKPFIRGITCYVIHQIFHKHQEILGDNLNYIKILSTRVYDDIMELKNYLDTYSKMNYYNSSFIDGNKFMDSAVMVHPELDYKIAHVIRKVDNYIEVLDNLKYLRKRIDKGYVTKKIDLETLRLAETFIKKIPENHKFKLNLHHYQKGGVDRLIAKYLELSKEHYSHNHVLEKITNYVEKKEI